VLFGIGRFSTDLSTIGINLFWFPFGIQFSLGIIASLLLAVVLTLLLLRRLVISLRKQRVMALDVKQAQEVQQVILPQARMKLPGFDIESEYRPALEVGGDFFQIIPHPTDGSLLIVAGDVVGKGLKAGMLVALLVGGIRTVVDWSTDPVLVLRALNKRLMGRGDSQATCLVLRIEPNGEVTLVNAGHLPPYLNGVPLPMEGALPLGMAENVEFSAMRFRLADGDRMALVSDGVVEATDTNGQLFGFERTAELLRTARSAAEVASAAQSFGQEDDISVISVTRTAVLEPALA
jgi:serine phosphatase RsbU (regulator of sigma subunit)